MKKRQSALWKNKKDGLRYYLCEEMEVTVVGDGEKIV